MLFVLPLPKREDGYYVLSVENNFLYFFRKSIQNSRQVVLTLSSLQSLAKTPGFAFQFLNASSLNSHALRAN